MSVVHWRAPDVTDARKVAWLSDHTRPFSLVLIQADKVTDTPLGHFGHLGVACADREDMDRKAGIDLAECVLRKEPEDAGETVGYYVFLAEILMVILWSFYMGSMLGSEQFKLAILTSQYIRRFLIL